MARVERSDILDFMTYGEQRPAIRASAMAAKALRRVHLGEHLTFLFENRETIRYQVLEMVRVEQMVREADIRHELDTYNAVLGDPGDLGCTLLIEITDERQRAELLRRWRDLPDHVYLGLADGTRAKARFDPAQMSEDKLSSVQFLQFPVGGRVPERVGVDLPGLCLETVLDAPTRAALASDLAI